MYAFGGSFELYRMYICRILRPTLTKMRDASELQVFNDVHDDFIAKLTVTGARQKLSNLANSKCCNLD